MKIMKTERCKKQNTVLNKDNFFLKKAGTIIFGFFHLMLGFGNILFAWLGLICFFTPLLISIIKGNKAYCNKYCGRGQLFSLLGGKFGLSRKKDI